MEDKEVRVSSDKGSLGDCSLNPLGVPLLQQGGDTGPSVKCHIPLYRERVSPCLALNRFISTTISPGPRARYYLTCRDVIPVCLSNKCNVQSTVQPFKKCCCSKNYSQHIDLPCDKGELQREPVSDIRSSGDPVNNNANGETMEPVFVCSGQMGPAPGAHNLTVTSIT